MWFNKENQSVSPQPSGQAGESDEIAPELHAKLQRFGAHLRQVPVADPGLERRVMATIRQAPRWRARALVGWCVRPRPVPISPLAGLVAVAAVAALVVVAPSRRRSESGARTPVVERNVSSPSSNDVRIVRFVLAVPNAAQVHLVGDFNGWNTAATPLRPMGQGGVWTVDVPLAPGRHEYAFVVDDREWRVDPSAPRTPANEYGQPNSVITVEAYSS